jgi:hypothetical protein
MFFKNAKLLKEANLELEALEIENAELKKKYANLIDIDNEINSKKVDFENAKLNLVELNSTYTTSLETFQTLQNQLELYSDSIDIGSYGLYEPQFSFDTSEKFKEAIEANYQNQKLSIKEDNAVICNTNVTVNGSIADGKKMTTRNKKLMLYAFNGECDGLISKVKWNTATKIKERIEKAFNDINKLGEVQTTFITEQYKNLKLEELALTYEYEQKKYDEKEEQRQIREQMREEEKAQKDLERAQKEAEDEEARFQKALDKAKKELGSASQNEVDELNNQISSLEKKLQEAHERKERAISMAQMTKVGHIYVISNIGAFGEDVVKIGMTRRLDPLDRVRELGDASVPFHFDVHAIIYSENAPQLENELHKKFNDRRLNRINNRKEFFKASLEEIESFVKEHADAEIEFTKVAEAREYRETLIVNNTNLIDKTSSNKVFPKTLL